jgi:hypothetical protein
LLEIVFKNNVLNLNKKIMKNPILVSVLLLLASQLFAQTTATDFTVSDCNGDSHTLFTELDSGKVVVICWVMPCGGCVSAALTAYNVAQSYESTNPGKVLFYLVDDYGNTSCTSVSSWGTSNIGENITATFADATIDMADYGSAGMPKTVVIGGPSHTVYYNNNNSVSTSSMQTAIESGLAETSAGIQNNYSTSNLFTIYPNPTANSFFISYSLKTESEMNIELYNLLGEKIDLIFSNKQVAGNYKFEINTSNLTKGTYLIKVNTEILKFQVVK